MTEQRNILLSLLCGIDLMRRIFFNLIFIVLLVGLAYWFLRDATPAVDDETVLVIRPGQTLVEQLEISPRGRALHELLGEGSDQAGQETLLRNLVTALERAAEDQRIKALHLDLNRLNTAGLTKLQDLAAAIKSFKESGKVVIASADSYSQAAWFVAAQADEIYLNPMGEVKIEGYSYYQPYFKEAIDRFGIEFNIFRVGTYKSAVEPFMRNDMSPQARTANLEWMNDLWRVYLAESASARGLDVAALSDYVEHYDRHVRTAGGSLAEAALKAGVVDFLAPRDAVTERLIEIVGDDEDGNYVQIPYADYLNASREAERNKEQIVAVIVARGEIVDGVGARGVIGGDSTVRLIRHARDDDDIKALVLRVDSGGGSAFASEIIRRELELTRAAGKPVVVSMGSVAASGGYWISMASDQVWAHPTTITGSIGVFGMLPTFQKTLSKYLGVHNDGVGTTSMAGSYRPDRSLNPRMANIIQHSVDDTYRRFIGLAAAARGMTAEQVDSVAQGRVWSGEDAFAYGLVDRLGGQQGALDAAAALAGLDDDYAVRYLELEQNMKGMLSTLLLSKAVTLVGSEPVSGGSVSLRSKFEKNLARPLELMGKLNDPNGIYTYSFIEVD